MTLKPGFITSEFTITAITQGIGLLVLSGKVAPQAQAPLTDFASALIKFIVDGITVAGMIGTALSYIHGRNLLKQTLIQTSATPSTLPPGQLP